MRRIFFALLPLALLIMLQPDRAVATDSSPARMSIQELKSRLGAADVQIIDVRNPVEWSSAQTKIQGAIRENPDDVDSWAGKYSKEKVTVLYCS